MPPKTAEFSFTRSLHLNGHSVAKQTWFIIHRNLEACSCFQPLTLSRNRHNSHLPRNSRIYRAQGHFLLGNVTLRGTIDVLNSNPFSEMAISKKLDSLKFRGQIIQQNPKVVGVRKSFRCMRRTRNFYGREIAYPGGRVAVFAPPICLQREIHPLKLSI